MSDQEKRKFTNPTPGWVGCTIINDEGKREGFSVEPGGAVWLSAAEERATAEAPRQASDNPFVKTWEEAVEFNSDGIPIRFETRTGMLVVSDEPPRPIASDRYTPPRAEEPAPEPAREEEPEEITGDDGVPEHTGPAPEGKPEPGEIVGTPEAAAANDAELAAREAEAKEEATVPVTDRPQDTSAIGVPPKAPPLPV